MTYAFVFDASACSGCKACQVACKDKNNLPAGVLWRRVYEVSGGTWQQQGEAWTNSVFACNLSMACNHCVHPKCAGVCPTGAYELRPDGIVYIDTAKCVGCGYCAWACPYDAPQSDKSAGTMTKCDLCYDNLDLGMPPACVASCPMRCLELVEIDGQGTESMGVALWKVPGAEHPFPLPKFSRTEPHLVIHPHPGVKQAVEGAQVSNREEISPASPHATARGEIPLLFFTLLAQMAIGAFGTIFMIHCGLSDKQSAREITFLPLMAVGAAITIALLVSFLHLGTPKNVWRMLNHLRKSWLSREILLLSAFAASWAILTGLSLFKTGSFTLWLVIAGFTLLCGLALLFSMQSVYRLRTVPGWNTRRTLLEFTGTALCLGSLLTGTLLPKDAPAGVLAGISISAVCGFLVASYVARSTATPTTMRLTAIRIVLLLAGLSGAILLAIRPVSAGRMGMLLVFMIALAEEAVGRWLFYARRKLSI